MQMIKAMWKVAQRLEEVNWSFFYKTVKKIWCLPDYADDKENVKVSLKVGGGELSLFYKSIPKSDAFQIMRMINKMRKVGRRLEEVN